MFRGPGCCCQAKWIAMLPGTVDDPVASYVKLYLVYHLWPEGEYPDILLVHTTKGMQVSMDTQLLCSMEHSQRLTAPHTNQMSGSKSPTWRKMLVTSHQEKVSHYCYIYSKRS